MTTSTLLEKIKTQKIGKTSVVVLPLDVYETIREELEMLQSKRLAKEIAKARKEKKIIPLETLLKENNLF